MFSSPIYRLFGHFQCLVTASTSKNNIHNFWCQHCKMIIRKHGTRPVRTLTFDVCRHNVWHAPAKKYHDPSLNRGRIGCVPKGTLKIRSFVFGNFPVCALSSGPVTFYSKHCSSSFVESRFPVCALTRLPVKCFIFV